MRKLILFLPLLLLIGKVDAQEYVQAFKHSRVINSHSVDMLKKGTLDVLIRHRFGDFDQGGVALFGLDEAITRLAIEYAPLEVVNIGLGRTSGGFFDLFGKVAIVRQKKDEGLPFSAVVVSNVAFDHLNYDFQTKNKVSQTDPFVNNISYMSQLLLASRLHERFSLQLMPTFIHYNWVRNESLDNDLYSLGAGASYRVSKHYSIIAEYFHTFNDPNRASDLDFFPALSLGLNIETAGHVFALHFSNAPGLVAQQYIRNTSNSPWELKNFRFGFNISRQFKVHR